MKAEIISIGSEITTGQKLDTNGQWLSKQLATMGIAVGFHTTVADDLADNIDVFRNASQRAQLVLTTGGLGPTLDDLTREVLAHLGSVPLIEDPVSLEHIQSMFAQRKRVMPERNRVQALCPQGAEMVYNARGTAPGLWMKLNNAMIGCMPGVPYEMFHMFETEIKPRILALGYGGSVQIERKINLFGWGESAVEEKVSDLTRRGHVPEVGITASDATISLRIIATGATEDEANAIAAPVEATIRERLGDLVYGVGAEELEDVVVRMLESHQLSIATAESVTGGLVAHRLTRIPGASARVLGGVVAYDPRVKISELAVPVSLIETHGAVSEEVVSAMALGCRARFGADLAVATVGLAGPAGGTPDKPVGLVYVALASAKGVETATFSWSGSRTNIQSRAAKLALNLVRLHLLQIEKVRNND